MKKLSVYTVLICLLLLIVPASANAEVGMMTLPSSVKIVEEEAFYGVAALDKVVIPEGTTEIHSLAFVGCSLTEVVLPSTLTYIASDAFDVNAFCMYHLSCPTPVMNPPHCCGVRCVRSLRLALCSFSKRGHSSKETTRNEGGQYGYSPFSLWNYKLRTIHNSCAIISKWGRCKCIGCR